MPRWIQSLFTEARGGNGEPVLGAFPRISRMTVDISVSPIGLTARFAGGFVRRRCPQKANDPVRHRLGEGRNHGEICAVANRGALPSRDLNTTGGKSPRGPAAMMEKNEERTANIR